MSCYYKVLKLLYFLFIVASIDYVNIKILALIIHFTDYMSVQPSALYIELYMLKCDTIIRPRTSLDKFPNKYFWKNEILKGSGNN